MFAIMFGASQMGNATAMGPDVGKAGDAAKRVFKIIESTSKIDAIGQDEDTSENAKKLKHDVEIGKIEFRDVWFRYPTRPNEFVLRGLNLTINPGETVALMGESGCGKSTFVNLMMRFYDPEYGTILLDDVDLKEYNIHSLRKAVSLVMQEPILFNYSILENILYGKDTALDSEVNAAARLANATEFIEHGNLDQMIDEAERGTASYMLNEMINCKNQMIEFLGEDKYNEEIAALEKLKEREEKKGVFVTEAGVIDRREESCKDIELHPGYDIKCGLKGGKLSGGQKQRIAIARTMIRKPKVLLLDEATSALDEDSQRAVQEALDQASKGRTTIIIAHRMSTIEACDKIFVLEYGRVSESGNFNDLKQAGGLFAKISQQPTENKK